MVVFSTIQYPKIPSKDLFALAKEAEATGIEWDDTAHLQAGHTSEATDAYWNTINEKLTPFSLVSNYTLGDKRNIQELFMPVMDSAFALHASIVRIQPLPVPSANADYNTFNKAAQELRTICDMANIFDMEVQVICRPNSLTDTAQSVCTLLKMANCLNCKCSWQPDPAISDQDNLASLQAVKRFLGSAVITPSWKKEYSSYLENSLPNVPMILETGRIN